MSTPTARDLIERLRALYSAGGDQLTDEALAAKLPISLRTFSRWKKNDTKSFDQIVQMLDEAGWLRSRATRHPADQTADPVPDPQEATATALASLLAGQEKIFGALGIERETPDERPGSPRRMVRR